MSANCHPKLIADGHSFPIQNRRNGDIMVTIGLEVRRRMVTGTVDKLKHRSLEVVLYRFRGIGIMCIGAFAGIMAFAPQGGIG